MGKFFKKINDLFSKYCPYEFFKYCIGSITGLIFCSIKTYYTSELFSSCLENTITKKHYLKENKMEKTQQKKKFYKSKLNATFTALLGLGTLIVNEPQLLDNFSNETVGYITAIVGTFGVIVRTFFTKTEIEI